MKPGDVNSNTYIDSSKEINDKDGKYKIGDIARISYYGNIFAKVYTSIQLEVSGLKKLKNTVQWTCVINDLKGEEIVKTF